MNIKPLIQTKSPAVIPGDASAGLKGFVPVTYSPAFVQKFRDLLSVQDEVLYNHSPIYPFAYLNKGGYRLFINEDWDPYKRMIPVVQQNFTEPSYFLYCPTAELDAITRTIDVLSLISKDQVTITDFTEKHSLWLEATGKFKRIKTGEDVIQDAQIITNLAGRNFSSIRNALKHVRNDLQPRIERLDKYTFRDAQKVFLDWKELRAKDYFRITIGRDLRLVEECYSWVDEEDFFGYVYYVDNYPAGASFGCRSWAKQDWGIDVMCKARIDCKGLSDFVFHHLVSQMAKKGIRYINDCVFATPGDKISKGKWQPQLRVENYSLVMSS